MHPSELEQLAAAAYKSERAASRRLAARSGIGEAEALHQVLTQAAGAQGLAALLAGRARLRELEQTRRAERARAQQARLALKRAAAQAPVPAHAWRAWFDGSAHPNPGRLGIGALLCGPDGERLEISRQAGHGNSGEAEYLALIAVLEAALPLPITQLVVYGDSKVVIDDVNLAPAVGAKGLETHRERVAALLRQLALNGAVSLRWVPRHRNGEADRLSQQAIASWCGQAVGSPD
ncbi:ribonuclease HI family protein [Duganella sp. LX20W]|uniref:Ribonuclease HI family protein n=1 Tax=Rugamonas brunnea TaxID=2758569 RepID=A0A7W2ESA1_9BURK|nr:ribonuclease HI family protein [Rugamonas brunnea]MBA5637579.1 ribonuclease HI family protein [Rugamonas brunnea]